MHICQGFHKIRCHGAPLLQIQLQTEKKQRTRFYAVCVSAPNRFGLVLCDVINYNDVISTTDLYESVNDLRFTDV